MRGIQDWVLKTLGIPYWRRYGPTIIEEQTVYKVQGQSHTSRHASVELRYAEESGDTSRKEEAVRQLNWATYMVDDDGKNWYPNFELQESGGPTAMAIRFAISYEPWEPHRNWRRLGRIICCGRRQCARK